MTVPDPLGRPLPAPGPKAFSSAAPGPDDRPLPFFVYGTLRPGEANHARHLRGRTAAEEPARLPGTLLYDGPGYPYLARAGAGDGGGAAGVLGELVTAAPGEYAALLAVLDALEEFLAPGHPLNAYERERCEAVRLADGARVAAWVYVAAPAVRPGAAITGGDWLTRPGRAPLPPPP
ncbi:gamma-glutamylcyclotransferase family protein [Streptomyces lichenis]|uniref:Gamma-glutamylcyclotransferase n=1 Tax=Streptomyces lichenis TaxID=2306967 RepID=A0ABT0I6M7_9ACTN|nr:gamma-glutamylcyclotransferase family protein [Streptomyces lichenis]MCK8676959.1 gamma-glutamylcyclotransferase [Streptomyces lichenis]